MSNPGYAYNINEVGETYYLTAFGNQDSTEAYPFTGKGWFIQTITSEDSSDASTWVEVCRWQRTGNDEAYVICSRDPDNDHDITVTVNPAVTSGTFTVYINGFDQGTGSNNPVTVPLTVPRGDVVILRIKKEAG